MYLCVLLPQSFAKGISVEIFVDFENFSSKITLITDEAINIKLKFENSSKTKNHKRSHIRFYYCTEPFGLSVDRT